MGGRYTQGYTMFQHLTVKAFLALRPHADQLINTIRLMLDTGLPSFKGEGTIKRLRDRFALGLSERSAADWMMGVVKNAHENVRSTAYDEFQRVSLRTVHPINLWIENIFFQLQNGAPSHKTSLSIDSHLPLQVYRISNKFLGLTVVTLSLSANGHDRSLVWILKNALFFVYPSFPLSLEDISEAIYHPLPFVLRKDGDVTLAQ